MVPIWRTHPAVSAQHAMWCPEQTSREDLQTSWWPATHQEANTSQDCSKFNNHGLCSATFYHPLQNHGCPSLLPVSPWIERSRRIQWSQDGPTEPYSVNDSCERALALTTSFNGIITKDESSFQDSNGVLHDMQYGFIPGRSCEHALLMLNKFYSTH